MSKVNNVCHLVISTKNRFPSLNKLYKEELYQYIIGILRNLNCRVITINGITEHIHILLVLHPSQALASVVKTLKLSTNKWLKQNLHFPMFESWSDGYFAASVTPRHIDALVKYIDTQEEHHAIYPFLTEIRRLTVKNNLPWYPEDW